MRKFIKFITILLITVIWSCGTRKVETEIKQSETKSAVSISETTVLKTDSEKESVTVAETDDYVVTPIDNSLPVEIIAPDGKKTTIVNGRLEKRTSKTQEAVKEKVAMSAKTDKAVKSTMVLKDAEKKKNTDRDSRSWWWLLLIPLAWYCYEKYIKEKV